MSRRLWRSGAVVSAGLLLVGALTGVSSASPGRAPSGPAGGAQTVHAAADTAAEQRRVAAYWTPARMRAAVPLEQLVRPVPGRIREVARGAPTTIAPTGPAAGAVTPQAFPEGGSAWTKGGLIARTGGRVFFTFGGRPASCSGTAVTSRNKSVVTTAGHCVKYEGRWHTNWVFVPGYKNGSAPYGRWSARRTMATPQWVADEDLNYDVGAAVMNTLGGRALTDVVGGQGITFNHLRGQAMYSFGYPAASPYDGSKLIYCSGTTFDDFLLTNDMGMACNMTGGSSGGPWFLQFSEARGAGYQNSVNSFKYILFNNWMFGPYFGAEAQALYNRAQRS